MIKWFCICGVFIFVNALMDERNYRIVLDEVNITNIDPEVFLRFDCELHQINNRSYYDSTRIFKYDIDDFWVHTELAFWKLNNQKMKIFDVKFDVCHFLNNIQKNRLLNIFMKNVKAHSNTEMKCPFQANVSHSLEKMYFDEKDFPANVPLGKFRNLIEFLINQKLSARLVIKGRIVPH